MINCAVKNAYLAGSYAQPVTEQMGDRIRTLREARRLTQEQLGKEVGVSKVAVSHWESGATKNIKLVTFLKLLEVLRTDYEYLVFGPNRAPADSAASKPKHSTGA